MFYDLMRNLIIFINFIFSIKAIKNSNVSNTSYLTIPSYVENSYLLLMFNGSSDLKKHAEFSEIIDEQENCIKYRGKWNIERTNSTPYFNDYSLVMKSKNVYSAIIFGLKKPFKFESECLVVQYDVRFPNDHDCGGAYIKLISETPDFKIKQFTNTTPFTVMFGPDKCGFDYEIKFIFEYKNPKTGKYEKRKFKQNEEKYPRFLGDNVTHVNTLMICENNSVQIYKDLRLIKEGNLMTDFIPPLGGETHIIDVNDTKPKDWDDREEINDPNARKPDDWDENEQEFIIDVNAKKPKNWLDNEPLMVKSDENKPYNWDENIKGKWKPKMVKNYKCKMNGCGKWSSPKIRNPKYRGKWIAPPIHNPRYRGVWKPRLINNPKYISILNPYKHLRSFNNLGIEVWSEKAGTIFDNFIITDNLILARQFAMHTWWPKYKVDTKDMPEYQSLFNDTKRSRRTLGLSAYIHWFWATIPLALGVPIIFYIMTIILKKSQRDQELTKENYLLTAYQNLKQINLINSMTSNDSIFITKPTEFDENIPDEAINLFFGGADDKIATIIRKRNRDKSINEQIKSPAGDTNY